MKTNRKTKEVEKEVLIPIPTDAASYQFLVKPGSLLTTWAGVAQFPIVGSL
jgi:hypothetical protein